MLLRRSCCCDGVAAATELRSTSLVALSSFCASRLALIILRVASRGATRRMMRLAFISPRVDLNHGARGVAYRTVGHDH